MKKKNKPNRKERRGDKNKMYNLQDQDDRFFFIAGYTSGGAPYGVTWEEMGLEPRQTLDDLDGESLEVSDTEELPFG